MNLVANSSRASAVSCLSTLGMSGSGSWWFGDDDRELTTQRVRRTPMKSFWIASALVLGFSAIAMAQAMPAEYQQVLTTLGKQGDFKANVLKVNIPRNDVNVTIANVKTPTPFGFGGWIAMTKGTGMDVMMGDLVLTQDEVNPVMSALLDNGLEVTALHNHFFWEEPRIFFMHVHGHGTPAELARKVKPAIDLIGKNTPRPAAAAAPAAAPTTTLDTAKLAQIVGTQGEQSGAVYKIAVGRDDLELAEMGAPINARMGLNTWAAFVGTNDKAAVAGDVAIDRKSTRLNSSHLVISYAVFCLKKKKSPYSNPPWSKKKLKISIPY